MDAEVLGHAHERTLILHLETKEFGHLFKVTEWSSSSVWNSFSIATSFFSQSFLGASTAKLSADRCAINAFGQLTQQGIAGRYAMVGVIKLEIRQIDIDRGTCGQCIRFFILRRSYKGFFIE